MVKEGDVLWEPTEEWKERSNIVAYQRWFEEHDVRSFAGYADLWNWSVSEIGPFWDSIFRYFGVRSEGRDRAVLMEDGDDHDDYGMVMGTRWFRSTSLNYAEHAFRNRSENDALIFGNETGSARSISWGALEKETAALAASLRRMGVDRGERVAAFVPNIPEAVTGLLACASIGAVWSSCSPDFGKPSVIDRFRQIEPKVLIGVNGSIYNGTTRDKTGTIRDIRDSLPTVKHTIMIPYPEDGAELPNAVPWEEATTAANERLTFEQLPFEHPLWILYSSGTTGLPKPLVHSHGGILLEHLKVLALHNDVKETDRSFWFTTTGWMMWNYVVGGLLLGSTVVLYDGSPVYPDPASLWTFAERAGITLFGTSAAYIGSCMKAGIRPLDTHNLSRLRGIGSTGSPLSAEAFEWTYQNVKADLWLASISGGTDLCTAFVGGCPVLPVTAGELQCRCLGAKVEAYNEAGESVVGEMGELVITEPMPSMPVYLWGDKENRRYRESYFDTFPGIWRHGDWIRINERGTCVIYGRSDATIKRHGVRLGTSEIYRYVEKLPFVHESLAIDLTVERQGARLLLFVVMKRDAVLDDTKRDAIRETIRRDVSPRFVPDEISVIREVPKTINGKKMEVPVKRILMGMAPEKVANLDSMGNPGALQFFLDYRAKLMGDTNA